MAQSNYDNEYPDLDGEKRGVKQPKGAHMVYEKTLATAAAGQQRVGIYFPGVWRLKGVGIKNPDAAVLEASRIMLQFGGGTTFDANRAWLPLDTGECDQDLEHFHSVDDKILRFATVYGEVTHLGATAHTLYVLADKIGDGDESMGGSPKPREFRREGPGLIKVG